MAIDSALTPCQVAAARAACVDPAKITRVTALKAEMPRARRMTIELRHLTALMSDDRYRVLGCTMPRLSNVDL